MIDPGYSEVTLTTGDASASEVTCTDSEPEKSANEQLQEYVIFVGNPGSGKSTLLNSLLGEVKFKSGYSSGKGLTADLQLEYHQGIGYGDTPGLSDVKIRKLAASKINEALAKHGKYKLVFVILLDSGRVRPDDLTTIQLVVEAIGDKSFPYGIVVNKATKKAVNQLNDEENRKEFFNIVNISHIPSNHLFLYPENEEATDEDNVLFTANPEFVTFLKSLESKLVLPEQVQPIQSHDFDEITARNERELAELRAHFERVRREKEIESEEKREKEKRIITGVATLGISEGYRAVSKAWEWIKRNT